MPSSLFFQAAGREPRLDSYLVRVSPDLSRSFLQRLIRQGLVTVNGERAKPSQTLSLGDEIVVVLPAREPSTLEPEPVPFRVVYEDAELAVVDKPAGVPVHPAPGHAHGTLVHGLVARWAQLSQLGGPWRPGVVHRLDMDTSGLILVAKHDMAHRALAAQWERREVEKGYLALVRGHLEPAVGRVEAPIGRDPRNRKRMAVVADGREAQTAYRTLEALEGCTLLEARPETGRTHQIRVHMAYLGHPLIGDALYGGRSPLLGRQFLHASWLRVRLPGTGALATFRAPLPEELRTVLRELGSRWIADEAKWLAGLGAA